MNKVIILLAGLLIMFIGLMVFNSGDDKPVNQTKAQQKPATNAAAVTEAERDDYVNTIKTINARAIALEKQIKDMQEKIDEQKKKSLTRQDVESIAERSSEQRTRDFKSIMDDKFNEFTSVLDEVKKKKGTSVQLMPQGLGLDQIVSQMNGKKNTQGNVNSMGSLGFPGQGNRYATITPLVTVSTIQSQNGMPDIKMTPDGRPLTEKNGDSGKQSSIKKKRKLPVPMYTIPQNATLFENASMTALLGIVPINGQIIDPVRFKVITGPENIATNGLYLPPGIKNIVWSGVALGNREMSCTYGQLNSVTFTFEDGRVTTINSQTDAGQDRMGGKMLGYIATKSGNPCIRGKLISNATQYLEDRMWASGFASAGQAFSDTQKRIDTTAAGIKETFNGDAADYILGNTFSGSLRELVQYLRDRQSQAIDIVYVPNGQDFVVHVEKEIKIDYDPNGRMIDHANQIPSTLVSATGALD